MKKKPLLFLAVASTCISLSLPEFLPTCRAGSSNFAWITSAFSANGGGATEHRMCEQVDGDNSGVICGPLNTATSNTTNMMDKIIAEINDKLQYHQPPSLDEIKNMLTQEGGNLRSSVINKVLTTFNCAQQYNLDQNNILTIIDYSLPSSERRLWVFDLNTKKLLFNTYVSHGIKSGVETTNYFSNRYNSKASSMGVYTTDQSYYGRHGLSLKLDGRERGFNDNAANRSVVMHGGWYVEENFIKRYGRAGRSWGCPAVPDNIVAAIINTIKEGSLFVVYYPSDDWLVKSKFLHCNKPASTEEIAKLTPEVKPVTVENETREDILYADVTKKNNVSESGPVLVVSADNYERIFHTKAPLERMLRRQINNAEYIALSTTELKNIVTHKDQMIGGIQQEGFNIINFVVPVIKMVRGYYATEMKFVNYGKINDVTMNNDSASNFTIHYEAKPPMNLKTTHQFIRWVGL